MDYPYIRAWEYMRNSTPALVALRIKRAQEMNAPEDAVYERQQAGGWRRLQDILFDHLKAEVEEVAIKQKFKTPG